MDSNIQKKVLGGIFPIVVIVVLIFGMIITMAVCKNGEDEANKNEFELVTCYIEHRNITNGWGGILRTDDYLHYGYVNENEQVIFDEMFLENNIDFRVIEGTPKLIIEGSQSRGTYIFQLTREMYENINKCQQ